MRISEIMAWLVATMVISGGVIGGYRLEQQNTIASREDYPGLSNFPMDTSRPPLKELAAEHDMYIGAANEPFYIESDPRHAEVYAREFNFLTTQNALKMDRLRPTRHTFDFTTADQLLEFAEAHGMRVRGHTLVWGSADALPAWLKEDDFTRDELLFILEDHIRTVVGRYRGRVHYWDVVNEAIDGSGAMMSSIFYDVIGPEYIDYAFQWAHEADPDAHLFYNDAGSEYPGPKAEAIFDLVAGMVDRGLPVHGYGMQMHTRLTDAFDASYIQTEIERYGALGLDVHITEMDVRIQGVEGTEEELFSRQATVYYDIARVCVLSPYCNGLITWGLADHHSWIMWYTGNPDAPLLFDENYEPKPAYYAVSYALEPASSHTN